MGKVRIARLLGRARLQRVATTVGPVVRGPPAVPPSSVDGEWESPFSHFSTEDNRPVWGLPVAWCLSAFSPTRQVM